MELWYSLKSPYNIKLRLVLMSFNYRIPSSHVFDYPIHNAIMQGTLEKLLNFQDKSTQKSLETFNEDCNWDGLTPIQLSINNRDYIS
jgi:hypothetical protein